VSTMTARTRHGGPASWATRRNLGRLLRGDHFGVLFMLLMALLVLSGSDHRRGSRFLSTLVVLLALAVASRASSLGRRVRLAFSGLGALTVLALALAPVDREGAQLVAASLLSLALFFLAGRCLVAVLRLRVVGLHALFGALSVYLFIGFAFAWAYRACFVVSDVPVLSGPHDRDFTYYSFVTLTTVGFGDVVAATSFVRRLTIIEALTGQVFLATVVARLVSLFRAGHDDAAADV
jgi:voltage-gated potassium channel Kch